MGRRVFIGIIIFLGLGLLPACDKYDTPPTLNFDSSFNDYILFKPGSYWIYQDSISGQLDSVVILSQHIEKKKLRDNFYYNDLTQEKYSSVSGNIICTTSLNRYHEQYYYLYSENNVPQFFDRLPMGTLLEEDRKLLYNRLYLSYALGKKVYSRIKEFQSYKDEFNAVINHDFYAAGIGLVQRGSVTTTFKRLIRYKVSS